MRSRMPAARALGKLYYLEPHEGFPRLQIFRCGNDLLRINLEPTGYQLNTS